MASTVKFHVFTDCDLDGAGSYLVYKWFNNVKSTYTTCRVNDVKNTYKNWALKNNINDFDTVYFFDLDVAQDDELISLIDRDNVVIVDEAQNMTVKELTTILTRISRNSTLFICGDTMQSDIKKTGFARFCEVFGDEESQSYGIHHLEFTKDDVMRDKIIGYLVEKIEKSNLN